MQGGVRRRADDAGEDTSGPDLAEEHLAGGATYGVGYGVDDAECGHGFFIVEGQDGICAQCGGLFELLFADAGDDLGAAIPGGDDGYPAYTADGTCDEDCLTLLDVGAETDELLAGQADEGKRGGLGEFEALGDFSKVGGFDDAELGVGGPGEAEDLVAGGKVGDVGPYGADDAREVAAEDSGEVYGEEIFSGAGAHFEVDGIDAGGCDADEDFVGLGGGVFMILPFELAGTSILVQNDCFHCKHLH